MKFIILSAAAFYLAYAVPLSDQNVELSSTPTYYTENYVAKDHAKAEIRDSSGQYGLSYQTIDGVQVQERGYLKPGENGTYYFVREGSYEYPETNGTKRTVKFLADETGFNVLN
ncbi:endocuticle structural glycoprotein SgAbd-5-like [Planococcus citri]|uniref:endocuticle structural glycoprotein SgAbd-5-like n=1 Tax=Planococcus citri TaxID=170843 RepID=UPI0031F9A7E1